MEDVIDQDDLLLIEKIANWSSALNLDAVPDEVVDVSKRCIVDLVGVTLAASSISLSRDVIGYARGAYASGSSSVLGFMDKLSPVGAALVNGTTGHVLDFDDTSYTGIMHGSTIAFPAALASVEHVGGDGRRLIEAFIAGSEVTYAVAMLCTTQHYFKGWWSTATFGVFGAAAAAAHGLGLDCAKTRSALALAGVQACGLKAAFGTDAKPYLAGRVAAIGVESAMLAAQGLSGPVNILEDSRGFIQLLNDGNADFDQIDKLGTVWRLLEPGIFFKQFPVCSAAHAAVELTRQLLSRNALNGDDVLRIVCLVTPTVAISLVHDHPKTPQEAQFSMPFSIGCILAYGDLDIACLHEDVLVDDRMVQAMARVEMVPDDSLADEAAPEGAKVTIYARDKREFSGYLGQPTGMPDNPMDDSQLHEKFSKCALSGGIDRVEAEALLQHICGLEKASSVVGSFRPNPATA